MKALRSSLVGLVAADIARFGHVTKPPSLAGVALLTVINKLRNANRRQHHQLHIDDAVDAERSGPEEAMIFVTWHELMEAARTDDPELLASEEVVKRELIVLQTAVMLRAMS